MTLTKRQKTLLAIFFVGLAALVVDRTFLRPQGGAVAASANPFTPSDKQVSLVANIPVLEPEASPAGVAQRLDRLWPAQEVNPEQGRDPFSLSSPWYDNVDTNGVQTPDEVALFVGGHQLTAVVIDPRGSYAVVNDRLLIPGQSLDGFRLVSVGNRSAVFEQGARRAVLELVNK
jgi:hypothetical protein